MFEYELRGPKGDNPLGFLTALGALLTLGDAGHLAFLGWNGICPRLVVSMDPNASPQEGNQEEILISILNSVLQKKPGDRAEEARQAKREMELAKTSVKKKRDEIKRRKLGREAAREARRQELEPLQKDLSQKKAVFKSVLIHSAADPSVSLGKELKEPNAALLDHVAAASKRCGAGDRRWVDLATAYGIISDAASPDEQMLASPWALGSGSGHQEFLGTVQELMFQCTEKHLRKALFEPWNPQDQRYSLRLDTAEDRRYALMARDPTDDDNKPRTLWGANRLAFEALRCFPAMPVAGGMGVWGWRAIQGNWQENCRVRWPLWSQPVGAATIRSLLGLRDLWLEDSAARERLSGLAVHAVMESRRIGVGQGTNKKYNMAPAAPVWISLFNEKVAAVLSEMRRS